MHGAFRNVIDFYERLFEIDPLSELACQRLVTLHSNKGMHNAAIKIYKTFRKTSRKELDSEFEDLTQSIQERLLQS